MSESPESAMVGGVAKAAIDSIPQQPIPMYSGTSGVAAVPQAGATVPLQVPQSPPPLTIQSSLPYTLTRIERLLIQLEAKALNEEGAFKTFAAKYWPIAVGALIALTRLL
jgi:hypothetical protein